GVHWLADSISRGVTTNDLEFLKTYLSKIQAVTAEDVRRVAKKYLDPEKRVVVWSVPQPGKKAEGGSGGGLRHAGRKADPPAAGGKEFSLKDVKRVVLDNGLTRLLFEDHRLPIVVADAHANYVR